MKALLFRVLSLVVAAMRPVSAGRNVALLSGEALNICDITARRRQWAALPLWVQTGKALCEHMLSAVDPIADIRHSMWAAENFAGRQLISRLLAQATDRGVAHVI